MEFEGFRTWIWKGTNAPSIFWRWNTKPLDRNMVGREGFEPPKAKPKDLQSSPFDHSGTDPCIKKWSHLRDLNSRPPVYKTGALPTELRWHVRELYKKYPFCQNFFPNWRFFVWYSQLWSQSFRSLTDISIFLFLSTNTKNELTSTCGISPSNLFHIPIANISWWKRLFPSLRRWRSSNEPSIFSMNEAKYSRLALSRSSSKMRAMEARISSSSLVEVMVWISSYLRKRNPRSSRSLTLSCHMGLPPLSSSSRYIEHMRYSSEAGIIMSKKYHL